MTWWQRVHSDRKRSEGSAHWNKDGVPLLDLHASAHHKICFSTIRLIDYKLSLV